MASTNFNYQVALKEGLKSLEQGRLRQAEQSFKYLVDKFPGAEGGYRGLAKVHFEQEDRAAALGVLRTGAAALIKAGERSAAIGLLREAVGLDPGDLATHRRLAAALALAGDPDAAVQEYARFIRDARDRGDAERAKTEVAYAKGQLRDVAGLSSLDAIAQGIPAPTEDIAPADEPAAPAETSRESDTAPRPHAMDPWSLPPLEPRPAFAPPPPPAQRSSDDDPWAAPSPLIPPSEPPRHVEEITLENDPWGTATPSASPSWAEAEPSELTEPASAPSRSAEATSADTVLAAFAPPSGNGEPLGEGDPAGVEAAAARYLATRDPRAAEMALEAARHYIKEGHTDAASDLLLQLIAAGVADHDAQRLLVDVARTLGKREVAKAKCRLLVQALLLDGRNDLAAEVEALALAD